MSTTMFILYLMSLVLRPQSKSVFLSVSLDEISRTAWNFRFKFGPLNKNLLETF